MVMVQAPSGENCKNKGNKRFGHYSTQTFESKAAQDLDKESASKRRETAEGREKVGGWGNRETKKELI